MSKLTRDIGVAGGVDGRRKHFMRDQRAPVRICLEKLRRIRVFKTADSISHGRNGNGTTIDASSRESREGARRTRGKDLPCRQPCSCCQQTFDSRVLDTAQQLPPPWPTQVRRASGSWTFRPVRIISSSPRASQTHLQELTCAELRNLVYDLADRNDDNKTDRFLYPRSYKGRSVLPSTLALTHVCRQIRNEYRDLHLTSRSITISLSALTDFLDTFFPLRGAGVSYRGDIHVEIEALSDAVDLVPIVKLYMAAPNLDINFLGAQSIGSTVISSTIDVGNDLNLLIARPQCQP
jgi:hypothetical protein